MYDIGSYENVLSLVSFSSSALCASLGKLSVCCLKGNLLGLHNKLKALPAELNRHVNKKIR